MEKESENTTKILSKPKPIDPEFNLEDE